MHFAFDRAFIDREDRGELPVGFVMTSDGGETIDEALWYALYAAYPSDVESHAVLVIANSQWAEEIEARLRDPEQLNDDMDGEEEDTPEERRGFWWWFWGLFYR
jgi:hypothetical protein